ncbi:uncharacterized protein RHIMIDRAFT_270899 [Rhizopus microsporus ATCC 52813]|uniref:Uncharacterized protein n=1 Tax=Rhizopus microsporus ATCC 52813 TaxID=1340429 RepID=A0A2G4SGV5_RHIZD|nr:uncharacterized protein RHIMIDRAFT_270899 [Rhizopus microsporus ATCC 52813]PHZ07991.1 hypothetical protein RHIMIDRAFT_270899 [Rhizopus microsporus ATCC 52813]
MTLKFETVIFIVAHVLTPPKRSRPNVTPVNDENATLSNTIEDMPDAAFDNIQSTSDMDEQNLRFSEFINEGEEYC